MSMQSDNLQVLAFGTKETLIRPCVDRGQETGSFCDGKEGKEGPPCLAVDRVPDEYWEKNQFTPFCTACEEKEAKRHKKNLGRCHFCRGMKWCRPP